MTITASPHVRGVRVLNRPASWPTRVVAVITDFAWLTGVLALLTLILKIPVLPGFSLLFGWIALILVFRLAQQMIFSSTLGQLIWRVRVLSRETLLPTHGLPWRNTIIYQLERLNGGKIVSGIFLTLVLAAGSATILKDTVLDSPAFFAATDLKLSAASPQGPNWTILPYFYSMGAWPKTFDRHPIFYALPYEKGPPQKFVGHIVADWDHPEIRVTIEGPHTPSSTRPADLKKCFTHSGLELIFDHACQLLRQAVLSRHIEEMKSITPTHWEFSWFEVDNQAFPSEDRPRGFSLSAESKNRAQIRYTFVNNQGSEQTFILDRPQNEIGAQAQKLFEESIRSQRYSDQLVPGRVWVDGQLSRTQLDSVQAIKDSTVLVQQISEIQALLLSKISVDPKTFDSYYHLGGTAYILAMRGLQEHNLDWTARAKPLLQSALRYTQDLLPEDPRTVRLRSLGIDLNRR